MSDTKDSNYPAFPVVTGHTVHSTGLSIRDYFAGQALAGIANTDESCYESWARDAYLAADAMLKARGDA